MTTYVPFHMAHILCAISYARVRLSSDVLFIDVFFSGDCVRIALLSLFSLHNLKDFYFILKPIVCFFRYAVLDISGTSVFHERIVE